MSEHYTILSAPNRAMLISQVEERLSKGWALLGGVSTARWETQIPDTEMKEVQWRYDQAMVKS